MFSEISGNLKNIYDEVLKEVNNIAEEARIESIKTATDNTPPMNDGKMRAKNAVKAGAGMKGSWATDSDKKVIHLGDNYLFHLKNDRYYASYVNDGHNLKKHFVPGLYINELTGLLEYDEDKKDETGIVVGTKTKFVDGYHMVEKAKITWDEYFDKNAYRIQNILSK